MLFYFFSSQVCAVQSSCLCHCHQPPSFSVGLVTDVNQEVRAGGLPGTDLEATFGE